MTVVHTLPGIGDIYWVLMKVLNGENSVTIKSADALNKRAHFLEHLQGVDKVEYCTDSYLRIKKYARQQIYPKLTQKMYMEANTHLERGNRIEEYYPHLPTNWDLKWDISLEAIEMAHEFIEEGNQLRSQRLLKELDIYNPEEDYDLQLLRSKVNNLHKKSQAKAA